MDYEQIFHYANSVMIERSALGSISIPNNIPTETFENSPEELGNSFNRISELSKNGILVIITNSIELTNIIIAMSSNYKSQGIICPAVYCQNRWYADAAMERINLFENTLIDDNGTEYIISNELAENSGLYVTDNGYIAVKNNTFSVKFSVNKVKKKYKPEETWGSILPFDRFNSNNYSGRLSECSFKLSQAINILKNIAENLHSTISPEKIYVFGYDFLITDKSEIIKPEDFLSSYKSTVFSVIFGAKNTGSKNDVYEKIIEYFIKNQCPDYLIDFFEDEFCRNKNSSVDIWQNVFSRYILEKH